MSPFTCGASDSGVGVGVGVDCGATVWVGDVFPHEDKTMLRHTALLQAKHRFKPLVFTDDRDIKPFNFFRVVLLAWLARKIPLPKSLGKMATRPQRVVLKIFTRKYKNLGKLLFPFDTLHLC